MIELETLIKDELTESVSDDLFANHRLLSTHNAHQARASVERVFFKHGLRPCNSSADSVNFVHRGASLSSLTFNLISYGADVEVTVDDVNRNQYIAVLPLTGKAQVKNHGEVADLEKGSLVVLDPLSRFRFEMQADHSHLAIGIPKQRLNLHYSKHCQHLDSGWLEFQYKPYLVKDINSGLLGFIEYLCNEVDKPGTITTQNVLATSLEETFLSMFISTLSAGEAPGQDLPEPSQHTPLYVQAADEFMEANLMEEITVNDVARVAAVPTRTLHHGFKKYRGVSPSHWLKIRRLRQARFDLLDIEQLDTSITDISFRYLQRNVGRFSQAYFNEFGEYPSDTRKGLLIGEL